jgi:tetratricopeptide (TPR) repeat protein
MINCIALSALFLISACSSNRFKSTIDQDSLDYLKEESFSRFSGRRIEIIEKNGLDKINIATSSCHGNKFFKGKQLFEDSMQQEKANPFYWNGLGTCYYLEGDMKKAEFFYDLGIEALKAYKLKDSIVAEASIENNLGLIHLSFNRFNDAFDAFTKSSKLVPSFITPKLNIAHLLIEFNQDLRALKMLKEIEDNARFDIDVLYAFALAHYRLGDFEQSFNYVSKIDKNFLNRADIVGVYAH